MDEIKLASGDNVISFTEKTDPKSIVSDQNKEMIDLNKIEEPEDTEAVHSKYLTINEIKTIDNNEIQLEQRIAQCKDIIASLKLELNEEKVKSKEKNIAQPESSNFVAKLPYMSNSESVKTCSDLFTSNMYSASVDSKLNSDESLLEYEKQLQRYQNTLNMAQIEKKNAIRKQMLAKAFKLKLLEVESQCNIELLRIKQSLECLEPLKLIMEKWKTDNSEKIYDINNFELIPRYPELTTRSGSDISSVSNADDVDTNISL